MSNEQDVARRTALADELRILLGAMGCPFALDDSYVESAKAILHKIDAAAPAPAALPSAPWGVPVRYEIRLCLNGVYDDWSMASKNTYDKFAAKPNVGEGCHIEVRALAVIPNNSVAQTAQAAPMDADAVVAMSAAIASGEFDSVAQAMRATK